MNILSGKMVDITPLFQMANIATGPLSIIETPGMYPYKEKIEDNWAYYTAVGCKRLKEIFIQEGKMIRNIGIIGICSGVEGIAVVHVFKPDLKRLIVTDIDDEILSGTVTNIGNAVQGLGVEVIPLLGSFCEPIAAAGYKVDFVHGNIPNLPAAGTEDLKKGAEKGTFLPAPLYEAYNPPEKFVGWALGAQYAYLMSAQPVLSPGGSVITELGGRIPLTLVQELFGECGFKLQQVITGFKEQTEALIDFIGYHRMEKQYGVSFDFYRFNEAKELLAARGIKNPTHDISGEEIKKLLAPLRVSAGEALKLYHQNVPVGHTVHIFRGVLQ